MKKIIPMILISSMLLAGCSATPTESVSAIESIIAEQEAAVSETYEEIGWCINMQNYSELPSDIQEIIQNFGEGNVENSIYLGFNGNYTHDNRVTYAFNINVEGVDTLVYATVDQDNNVEYSVAEDFDTEFDAIVEDGTEFSFSTEELVEATETIETEVAETVELEETEET